MRNGRVLAAIVLVLPLLAVAAPRMPSRAFAGAGDATFALRAPHAEARVLEALPEDKSAGTPRRADGTRVGSVRAPSGAKTGAVWIRVADGWVARFVVTSGGAAGLRALISLPDGLEGGQVVARGTAAGAEGFAAAGTHAWTPWTEGSRQEIEVFSRGLPVAAPAVESIVHFEISPIAKAAAGACSPDVACPSGDDARDAAIAERRNSVAMLSFVDGKEARVCTGTLLNTEKFPAPFLVTANHCIATAAAAASVTTIWFNEASACGSAIPSPALRQVPGGATLVFTSFGADSTLLRLKADPPEGAVFAGWDATRLAEDEEVVSISHPQGDVKKFALGAHKGELLVRGYPQELYGVSFSRGVTEGGSSGSGLFTLAGGSLRLRGVLSGSTARSGSILSCSNYETEEALYGRFEIFLPQIADFIAASPPFREDDYGNRITEAQRIFPVAQAAYRETAYPGRIDYPGDVDVFRVDIPSGGGTLTLRTEGGTDTIGTLLDSQGHALKSVNDAESERLDFGLTRTLPAGTYYLAVSHRDAEGTGDYTLKAAITKVAENYTDVWANPSESGWGVNINHQGQTLFVTVYTYDLDGRPMWLVASAVTRQPAGYWEGTLSRTTGPVYYASPWTPAATSVPVGKIRITFTGLTAAKLSYSVDGRSVNKTIERFVYSVAPTCRWSAFDRSFTTNFQDLWSTPGEDGWGISIAHQGHILLATIFTYDAEGRGIWLVMSRGERVADGLYVGNLYKVEGPPFDASPWREVTTTRTGTLTVQFTRGNDGTISYTHDQVLVLKRIKRFVFGAPATECFAPGDD